MDQAWSPTWAPDPTPHRPMTLEAWAEQPEDQTGEIVGGLLVEEEMPDPAHEMTVSWLIFQFMSWLRGKGGFVFGSEVKLGIAADKGRKADVAVYLPGTNRPPRRGLLTEPPDIVVEVVTPTPRDERRDRVEKMAEYAEFGVPFYWIVDPALGSLEVFELTKDGRYARALGVTAGHLDEIPGCADLSLDLDELWRELDRLA